MGPQKSRELYRVSVGGSNWPDSGGQAAAAPACGEPLRA